MPTIGQSAVLVAPGKLELVEESLADPVAGQVLVKTLLGSVSVGTELAEYTGSDPRMASATYPIMTGYENVAEVIAVDSEGDLDWLGKRILASYGHQTHAIVAVERLIPIPDDVPDGLAMLAILAADTDVAVQRVRPQATDRCLITGAGALGILTLLNLQRAGIRDITITDSNPNRLVLPRELGAYGIAVEELKQQIIRESARFSAVFECSASPSAFLLSQRALQHHGRLAIVSDGNGGDFVLVDAFHDRELVAFGCNSHPELASYAEQFFRDALTGELDAYQAIFDREIKFQDLPTTFAQMAIGDRPRKPLVRYD